MICIRRLSVLSLAMAVAAAGVARGQLVVTEIMNNPLSSGDDVWEWLEVQNTSVNPINLDAYYAARLGDQVPSLPAVNSLVAANTTIPGESVAVLYRGDIPGTAGDYDDQAFRDAWGLSASVPLIAVENWPALTNGGGTAVGFWPATGIPAEAIIDDAGTFRVDNFMGAAFSIDYTTANGYPEANNGFSITWNGTGSNQVGTNWVESVANVGGATTSVAVTANAAQINDTRDIASPGAVPAGPASSGWLITEIMYNPRSPENDWEWVEIYNNTGSTVDLSGFVFSDLNSGILAEANITSGSVANGEAAVLFNAGDITLQNMIDAWDPGGANGVNFIGVNSFPELSNSPNNGATTPTERVALWSSLASYQTDNPDSSTRSAASAVASVLYDDDGGTWPFDNGDGSIYLTDLSADPSDGLNWLLSTSDDGISFPATAAFDQVQIHDGGDVGSPGTFVVGVPTADADFDDDLDVDGTDLATWESNFGLAATATTGDANGDSFANGADFLLWQRQHTGPGAISSVPEPSALALLVGSGVAAAAVLRRRRIVGQRD